MRKAMAKLSEKRQMQEERAKRRKKRNADDEQRDAGVAIGA